MPAEIAAAETAAAETASTEDQLTEDQLTESRAVEPAARPAERLPTWPTLGRGESHDFGIFQVEAIDRRSPRTGRVGTYRVLHAPLWVNLVATTVDNELVLVEQYRHGLDELTLEIPGGMVDPGEDPADAGARELLEETGFAGQAPQLLGMVHPNPAFQDNELQTYWIAECRRVAEPSPDEGEHLRVVTVPLASLHELVLSGEITHSLVVAAAYWLALRGIAPIPTGQGEESRCKSGHGEAGRVPIPGE